LRFAKTRIAADQRCFANCDPTWPKPINCYGSNVGRAVNDKLLAAALFLLSGSPRGSPGVSLATACTERGIDAGVSAAGWAGGHDDRNEDELSVEGATEDFSGLSRPQESDTSLILSIHVEEAFGPVRDTRAGASFSNDVGECAHFRRRC
jgi:hypothetical protein